MDPRRLALADPAVRRLRKWSVIILGTFALLILVSRFREPGDAAAALGGAAVAAWSAYWVGLDRGLDALAPFVREAPPE